MKNEIAIMFENGITCIEQLKPLKQVTRNCFIAYTCANTLLQVTQSHQILNVLVGGGGRELKGREWIIVREKA